MKTKILLKSYSGEPGFLYVLAALISFFGAFYFAFSEPLKSLAFTAFFFCMMFPQEIIIEEG